LQADLRGRLGAGRAQDGGRLVLGQELEVAVKGGGGVLAGDMHYVAYVACLAGKCPLQDHGSQPASQRRETWDSFRVPGACPVPAQGAAGITSLCRARSSKANPVASAAVFG
jgi:hypothetical protein